MAKSESSRILRVASNKRLAASVPRLTWAGNGGAIHDARFAERFKSRGTRSGSTPWRRRHGHIRLPRSGRNPEGRV